MVDSMRMIPLASIDFNPDQLRKTFDPEKLDELKASILERGVIQPIIVKKQGEKFLIVIGDRRVRAAKLANFSEIPAIIENNLSRSDALELALIENMQRDDLTPFEEGFAIVKLMKDHGYTIEQVAKKIGISASTVRMRIKLVALPKEVQEHVINGELPIQSAIPLTKLKSTQKQIEKAKKIIEETTPLKQVKEEVKHEMEEKRIISEKQRKFESALSRIKHARVSLRMDHREFPVEKWDIIKEELRLLAEQLGTVISAIDKDQEGLAKRKQNAG